MYIPSIKPILCIYYRSDCFWANWKLSWGRNNRAKHHMQILHNCLFFLPFVQYNSSNSFSLSYIIIIIIIPSIINNRLSSSSKNPKRTSRGTRSNSVVVARVRPTTVNASVYAVRPRTSTNLPNTDLLSVLPTSRLFVRLHTLLLMEIGF